MKHSGGRSDYWGELVSFFVLGRPSTLETLTLCCQLAEVFGTSFCSFFPALCSQRGRWGLLEKIIGEMNGSGEEFVCSLCAAFGKFCGGEQSLCF